MSLRQENKDAFKALASPVWSRVSLPEGLFPSTEVSVVEQIINTSEKVEVLPFESYVQKNPNGAFLELKSRKNLGHVFNHYINGYYNSGYVIRSTSTQYEPPVVELKYELGEKGKVLVDNHLIIAEEGTKLDVILDYGMSPNVDQNVEDLVHYGITRIVAKQGSVVRVFKLQRLSGRSHHFDQVFTDVSESAVVDVYDVQMGSHFKAISYESNLEGRHSENNIKSLYFGDENSKSDLSFTMNHFGKKSNSSILSKGALEKNALKVFRGNLFFNTGSSQSVGKEEEFVMLLGDAVKSDSIPALMCSEDDVIGEHAASVGQVDLNKLFYLMSRGFSENEAKKLVIKASYEEILADVPYASFKEAVSEEVDRRVG